MDTKNRLTGRLLKVAKKHRILTYPVLALVALISVFSYFFNWSTGAGKRVVAIVMVLVMLVSQSYFLTSSATEITDDSVVADVANEPAEEVVVEQVEEPATPETEVVEEAGDVEDVLDESEENYDEWFPDGIETLETNEFDSPEDEGVLDEEELLNAEDYIKIVFDYVDYNATNATIFPGASEISVNASPTGYDISGAKAQFAGVRDGYSDSCYKFSGMFLDANCSVPAPDVLDASSPYIKNIDGAKSVVLYCLRELKNYKVTFITGGSNDPSDIISFNANDGTSDNNTPAVIYVPANGDSNNKSGSFTMNNFNRYGYKVDSVTDGASDGAGGFTVNLSGQTPDKDITITWTPETYSIRYSKKKSDDTTLSASDYTEQPLEYGKNNFYTQAEAGAKDYPGFQFKGWTSPGGSCNPGSPISMAQHHNMYNPDATELYTLVPDYDYVGISCDPELKPFQYQVAQEQKIVATYNYSAGSNRDKSGKFTYNLDGGTVTALAGIGITVTTDENGIYLKTDGPTTTSIQTPDLKLSFTVEDENHIPTGTITVPIVINPQTVSVIIPEEWKVKDYDTNNNVNTFFSTTIPTGKQYPNGQDITVSRTDAKYNDANAGTDKVITIYGCALNVPSQYTGCYVLEAEGGTITVPGCTIKPIQILVGTECDVDEIRTGEENPNPSNYHLKLVDGSNFKGTDSLETIKNDVEFVIKPSRTTDEEKLVAGKYYVKAQIKENTSSNYILKCYDDDCDYFMVTQEAPVYGTNYKVTGTEKDNGWFVEQAPVITPISSSSLLGGGYDLIRIKYSGDSDFTAWSEAISLNSEKIANGPIQIQLSSNTGAITSVGQYNVKYDPEGPTYLGYTFTVDNYDDVNYSWDNSTTLGNGGLYFPSAGGVLSFGTYINSTIRIKVHFEDNDSGLRELKYSIFSSDLGQTATFDENGYASIEILRSVVSDGVGVVKCEAFDKAGLSSGVITLKPKDNENGNYEWSVEEAIPSVCSLSITYGDAEGGTRGYVSTNTGIYYRHCVADLHVVDNESGVKCVKWYLNGSLYDTQYPYDYSETNLPNSKITTYDFKFGSDSVFVSSKTPYTLQAVVVDNAGNEKTSGDPISFLVDNDPPEVNVDYDDSEDSWSCNEEITFTTTDAISGVRNAWVLDSNGITTNITLCDPDENGVRTGSFVITGKGKYTVNVQDNANNVNSKEINVQNISTEVPECPEVVVSPTVDSDGESEIWYNSVTGVPTITINYATKTSDDTTVKTYYRHSKNDETAYDDVLIDGDSGSKVIPIDENDEAIHYIVAWSESISGMKCLDSENHLTTIRYDKTAPEITPVNVPEKSSGSSVYIQFDITDNLSGVDKESIQVLHNGKPYAFDVEETEDGYTGSFTVAAAGNYVIEASDVAGNKIQVPGFTPMTLIVDPVNNLTISKATVTGKVLKGTATISNAPTVSIKKKSGGEFVECENTIALQDEDGNWSISNVFEGLDNNTVYCYKVRAVSDLDEVQEYIGYFKTISAADEGGIVKGTAGYPMGSVLPSWNTSGIISVGLFDGNVCVAATQCDAGGPFAFTNVPDGNYTIIATDGVYKKSMGITVNNHVVVNPSTAISIILSGQNTSVVILTPDTPNITATNMDSIFFFDTEVNFPYDPDQMLVENGGTVEFRLYASLMNVGDVSSDEQAVIGSYGSAGKVVRKYLSLTLVKIETDAEGNVGPEIPVTELSNGASITITIPLQELAGKSGIEVVRVHDGSAGLEGLRYSVDMDSSPNTFTLTSNKFSTYAILAPKEPENTEEIMSTTEIDDSDMPEFDNIVDPSTPNPPSGPSNPTDGGSGSNNPTPIQPNAPASASFGSVSSGGSAKTGDAAPIAGVAVILIISLAGVVVCRRKINE